MAVKDDRVVARQPAAAQRRRQQQRIEPGRAAPAQIAGRQEIGLMPVLAQRVDPMLDRTIDRRPLVGGPVESRTAPACSCADAR
jgi:hypothetical protein